MEEDSEGQNNIWKILEKAFCQEDTTTNHLHFQNVFGLITKITNGLVIKKTMLPSLGTLVWQEVTSTFSDIRRVKMLHRVFDNEDQDFQDTSVTTNHQMRITVSCYSVVATNYYFCPFCRFFHNNNRGSEREIADYRIPSFLLFLFSVKILTF